MELHLTYKRIVHSVYAQDSVFLSYLGVIEALDIGPGQGFIGQIQHSGYTLSVADGYIIAGIYLVIGYGSSYYQQLLLPGRCVIGQGFPGRPAGGTQQYQSQTECYCLAHCLLIMRMQNY